MSTKEENTVQQITPYLSRENLHDGRIVIFTLTSMTRATVDAWVSACVDIMRVCAEEDQTMLILQDLSHPDAVQTPYSKKRGAEATSAYPHVRGRTAFILPKNVLKEPIRHFMQSQSNQSRERDAFHERENALAWLREWL